MFFWQSHGILNNLLCEKDGAVFFLFALTCTDSLGLAHTDSHTHTRLQRWFLTNVWESGVI